MELDRSAVVAQVECKQQLDRSAVVAFGNVNSSLAEDAAVAFVEYEHQFSKIQNYKIRWLAKIKIVVLVRWIKRNVQLNRNDH